jgi:NADH dehydrogenase [ubiquinone] 1 alpha subcomplex assembly factor 6
VKGETTGRVASGGSSLAAVVRRHDHDRYQTALFASVERRAALFALYAFNYEIARVRETVTQPMLGQIRLQWWREVIDAAYAGGPTRQHEIALPLTGAIRDFDLPRAPFGRMIDAREQDLGDEPPPDLAALVAYAEATSASLMQLSLLALGVNEAATQAAAKHAGIAYGLAGLLRAMPFHARTGRRYIPDDVAARAALDLQDYAGLRATPALRDAAAEIAAAAQRHLEQARALPVPRLARPGLLAAVIARRFLVRLQRAGHDPFAPALQAPDALQIWRLAAAMLTRRI